jgi:hypothetical protein
MTSKRMQRLGVRASAAMNPALNAPLVAYLANNQAAGANGQVFSRRGFAYMLFQTSPDRPDVEVRRVDPRRDRGETVGAD